MVISVSRSVVSDALRHYVLYLARLLCPWNSPGKNTGVGSCPRLQGIFPSQGSNLGFPHCRQILYCLSHQRSPEVYRYSCKLGMRSDLISCCLCPFPFFSPILSSRHCQWLIHIALMHSESAAKNSHTSISSAIGEGMIPSPGGCPKSQIPRYDPPSVKGRSW